MVAPCSTGSRRRPCLAGIPGRHRGDERLTYGDLDHRATQLPATEGVGDPAPDTGRDLHGAYAGSPRRNPRDHEAGGRTSPGPVVPARAPRVHHAGHACPCAPDPEAPAFVAGLRARTWSASMTGRTPGPASRPTPPRPPESAGPPGTPARTIRLCHLHVGLDRAAKGVLVTHGNLAHSTAARLAAYRSRSRASCPPVLRLRTAGGGNLLDALRGGTLVFRRRTSTRIPAAPRPDRRSRRVALAERPSLYAYSWRRPAR